MGMSLFWNKFSRNPSTRLARTRQKLNKLVQAKGSTAQISGEAWACYARALKLAAECGRDTLAGVVNDVDPMFPAGPAPAELRAPNALTLLLSVEPLPEPALEAALRLAHRKGEVAQIRNVEHRICLSLARRGDADRLVWKLLDRRKRGLLGKRDLEEIVEAYLNTRGFEAASLWVSFFEQLAQDQLPHIHQVHALLGRYREAAEIAEERGDFRAALRYLLQSPGLEAAKHAIRLNEERVQDPESAALAHRHAAEALWQQEDYLSAAEHFQKAGEMERSSDCYLNAGQIADSIKSRPVISPSWLAMVREKTDDTVRHLVQAADSLAAIRLLHGAVDSLRTKGNEACIEIEIARLEGILRSMVRTARASLTEEARNAAPGAEVFRRWSAIEEAAGNFLEAGIQAELGHDYLTAALMFEKAGAYGQALRAFEQSPGGDQVERKAALLERGGDFFMAGLLYQSLGQTENAIRMFEQSGDFPRAATLLREQLGDEKSALDDRYLKLAASAGRAEDVAQLCWDCADRASPLERGRFLRRIKQMVDEGHVAGIWSERVALEMAATEELDRVAFSSRAGEWAERAAREILREYADVLGIDLGTSNTVVALYHKGLGQPEVVQLENKPLIPSIFGIDDSGLEVVGVSAAAWLSKAPRAVVTEAKRVIGSGKSYKAGGRVYQPEEISARILQCAQQRASEYLRRKIADRMAVLASGDARSAPSTDWIANHVRDHPPSTMFGQAVVTVPAYFNEAQKQATRAAAEIAGIKLLRLVHEPTAACLAQRQRKSNTEAILVVDLGAGTLDLSLVQLGDGVYEVQEIEGDANLGSADLDKILFAHCQRLVTTSCGGELDRLGQRRLMVACEELKIELSFRNSAAIDLLALVDNKPFHMELTRDEFLALARPWLDRIIAVCRKVKSKPDRLLLVGGGTLMPAVRDCIQGVFGLDANTVADPLTVVARGAVIQAAILAGVEQGLLLVDATPFSLGIKAWVRAGEHEFNKLIPRHTAIPTRCSKRYTTVGDNQTIVGIHIYQGESSDPEQNFKIGEFNLEGLIPAKAGVPQVDVTFDINANCLLTVTARDVATGKECGINIEDSHLLTPAQMSTMKERLHKSSQLDEVRKSLSRTAASLAEMLENRDLATLPQLQSQLRDLLAEFEAHLSRHVPAASDNVVIMDLYRRRDSVSVEVHLLLDKWSSLQRSTRSWLAEASQLRPDRDDALEASKTLAASGEISRSDWKTAFGKGPNSRGSIDNGTAYCRAFRSI